MIGKLFGIKTKQGIALLHCSGKDDQMGYLVRVLEETYTSSEIKLNLDESVLKERFMIFFPLKKALSIGIVFEIDSKTYDVKLGVPKFMREPMYQGRDFLGWRIVNVESWERTILDKLDSEHIQLSPFGVWDEVLLIEKIEADWKLSEWIN